MTINTMGRSLAVSATALLCCTTMSLSAHATLPGSARSVWSWSASSGTDPAHQIDLGSATNKTCFLSGIGGNLALGDPVSAHTWAYVYIDPNNHYKLTLSPGSSGSPAEAHATCLFTAPSSATPDQVSVTGNRSVTVAPVATGRQCFLTGVESRDNSFQFSNPRILVSVVGSNWVLTNSGLPVNDNSVDSYAQCVDVPAASVFQWNNWTGTFTVSSMPETTSARVACGLRGFQGNLNGTTGSDGVNLNWPTDPGDWNLTATNGKAGWFTCLQ